VRALRRDFAPIVDAQTSANVFEDVSPTLRAFADHEDEFAEDEP